MVSKCPGQDTRFWGPDDIYSVECPKCGRAVEFFKDDIRRRCRHCGFMFLNPRLDLGCATWCQYAEQCVGAMGRDEFREILTLAVKDYFDGDRERINDSLKILEFAERILEKEGGNPKVVIAAAVLREIGLGEEDKGAHKAGKSNDEGDRLDVVKAILERSGSTKEIVEEVSQIIQEQLHNRRIDTLNSKIVYDAGRLAGLSADSESLKKFQLKEAIKETLLTPTGRKIAEELYL
jgi:Zn ribbon nucleic-acid-binding protein